MAGDECAVSAWKHTLTVLIFATSPEQTAGLVAWASARIPHLYGGELGPCVAGGVVRHGQLAAVVAFYDWRALPDGGTLKVSVAAETVHWARPHVIAAIYHYAFKQAGAYLLEVGTPLANTATCQFLRRIGFQQDGILPHRYGRKKHMAAFSITADQWRRTKYFKEV
jgi:RimJ/RimL family protein N-acetyltransferase